VPDDRIAVATAELYGAAPEAFTERRGQLAAAARDAGDRAAAKAIAALRRPTRPAWVVNRLARADPGAPPKLAELASALRAAQEARHGSRLRELSAARGALVDALTEQALAAADVTDPPSSLRLEVSQTLTAALADPEVAAAFTAGTLTRAVQWSGFGVLPADTDSGIDADADVDTGADSESAGPDGTAVRQDRGDRDKPGRRGERHGRPTGQENTSRVPAAAAKTVPPPRRATANAAARARPQDGTRPPQAADHQVAPEAAARRQAEEEERLAREAAERAAQRREQYAEAERVAAVASSLAADAASAEDRLEVEVRGLEQRLTQARADLAAARMRARHAEAAERRARQALDRLSG
jgi:hypothetical protein